MKTIKATHIDTGGHGYYSVSKKDIALLGIQNEITGYSGHTLDRVYLEEDCDGNLLYDRAKELGITIVCKRGYNLKFAVKHNYNPELFDWQPTPGTFIKCGQNVYKIFEVQKTKLLVVNRSGKRFKISLSNPFRFIDGIEPAPADYNYIPTTTI